MRGMRPRRASDESMRRCGMAGRKYCGRTSAYRAGKAIRGWAPGAS